MITVRDVSHRYDKQVVLDEVGLTLPVGQLTSIVGANGAGKSTLLSVISRLIKPESGSVFIDDLDVQSAGDDAVAKRLAVLRQDNRITARLSVVDLARFGRFPYSKGRLTPEDHVIVDEALDYLDLQPLRDRYLDQLSGGQRQRAYIAMILAQDTDYILLDEPLNNLDMKHSSSMMTLLRRAADDLGKTIVLVLHDINFASCFSDHIVAMRDGKVVVQGTPAQIMHRQTLREVFDMDIHVQDLNGVRLGIFWTTGAPVGPTPGFGEPLMEPDEAEPDEAEPDEAEPVVARR
ncbi:iron ABC transporter ATP-binding protein [Ornithinimicrobium cryptoxanthini]|uniref:iron ABC transporter ATP-binding protein n=1 Tax=Ornithinimicrobium cryptoxanthini TaxID=2934161 RepID=UPI0021192F23|nr:ATP-binding cassette domain-containing protein [Ornithinimicrobium cryptoxanthini]